MILLRILCQCRNRRAWSRFFSLRENGTASYCKQACVCDMNVEESGGSHAQPPRKGGGYWRMMTSLPVHPMCGELFSVARRGPGRSKGLLISKYSLAHLVTCTVLLLAINAHL